MELAPITRQRAVDAVYEVLKERILTHSFKPGERLMIDDLAAKLGVSLTPVRVAVQQLANEGLVEIRPRNGTFVASLTSRDIEETFDLRCALECLAAEKAVERITANEIDRLRKLHEQMGRDVTGATSRKAHEHANSEFHLALIDAAQNKRLAEMYKSLNAHLKIARIHSSDASWRDRLPLEFAEHAAIIHALEARDAKDLTTAVRRHICRAKDVLIASLELSQSPTTSGRTA